ncbi:hypothetical protein F4804DRAFT_301049 [Jackrogersella minutella]|nr:hypothetical protein F4804DRAFT_301049 [Jackrogersella minutella]
MSIQQLPDNVIAQIKSSTTITSLNSVVCGLVKNSLDAEATKINISIDYARGNCSVEDNGLGIPPSEFKPTGGLGKLHHTSKFTAHNDLHGRHGTFIASVAALSLLSLTSHHHRYHSHNTIKFHNSEVLARHIPALAEQKLLSFPHGTRTTVRDLFGCMPVRVKQRAIDAERGVNAKDCERLKRSLVALLLAWSGQVSISLRDSVDQRNFTIRIPEEPSNSQGKEHDVSGLTTRVSRVLFQAQLCDDRPRDLWVPLRASAGSVSVVGAVSLIPTASRHVQFISLGVRPVSNDHGSNILYEQINRLFANSSFGVEEGVNNLDADKQNRGAKDRRFKSDGYTNQELRGRKGVDRWPMFYIKVNLREQTPGVANRDVEDILDGDNGNLTAIVDIMAAVVYEFLKANHFRPRNSRPRRIASSIRSSSRDKNNKPISRSPTPRGTSGTDRARTSQSHLSTGDLTSTRLNLAPNSSRLRPESPFDSWTRIKSGQPQYAHLHEKHSLAHEDDKESGYSKTPSIRKPPLGNDVDISDTPLVAPDGTLLRLPFLDVEMDTPKNTQEDAPRKEDPSEEDTVLWTNPTTKEIFVIDARTGLVLRPLRNVALTSRPLGDTTRLPLRKKLRTNTKPIPRDERSQWLGDLLSSWDNPVFQSQEPLIPVAFDEEKAFALATKALGNCCHGSSSKSLDFTQASRSVEGRLSKDNLPHTEVIAQVDRKFIFAKVPLSSLLYDHSGSKESETSLLVIIDQHAADERCRVEALMRNYFMTVKDDITPSTGQCQQSVHAQVELLEKPIIFDISAQDLRQFELSAEYFQHWGIMFEFSSAPKAKRDVKGGAKLNVFGLPPSIAERCRSEPRLLIELLRKEAWKLDEQGRGVSRRTEIEASEGDDDTGLHWLARFHGCPHGILEMINSRACRSSIMFNDELSQEQCVDLVKRLAGCALPFQCAHGRPSMVPLLDLGNSPMSVADAGEQKGSFGKEFRRWKSSMDG